MAGINDVQQTLFNLITLISPASKWRVNSVKGVVQTCVECKWGINTRSAGLTGAHTATGNKCIQTALTNGIGNFRHYTFEACFRTQRIPTNQPMKPSCRANTSCDNKLCDLWRHPVDRTCSAGVPALLMKGPIPGIPLRIRHLTE